MLRRAAVLGSPVGHSLSPALHRAAWAAVGFEGSYDARECPAEALPGVLAEVRGDEAWVGLSLTMPLKEVVLGLVDEVSPRAASLGTANTVLRRPDGSLWATSTDGDGVLAAVQAVGAPAGPVAILGAGGTARAALGVLPEAVVVARSAARAAILGAPVVTWSDFRAGSYALVVSTTPSGATDGLAESRWPADVALVDVVYDPWPTRLGSAALSAGAAVCGGLEVLVGQAVEQVELMTGRRPDPAVLRAAGESQLAGRARPDG